MKLKHFTCRCGYRYVIGWRKVFGPFIEGFPASHPRWMSKKDWRAEYGDCANAYKRKSGTVR